MSKSLSKGPSANDRIPVGMFAIWGILASVGLGARACTFIESMKDNHRKEELLVNFARNVAERCSGAYVSHEGSLKGSDVDCSDRRHSDQICEATHTPVVFDKSGINLINDGKDSCVCNGDEHVAYRVDSKNVQFDLEGRNVLVINNENIGQDPFYIQLPSKLAFPDTEEILSSSSVLGEWEGTLPLDQALCVQGMGQYTGCDVGEITIPLNSPLSLQNSSNDAGAFMPNVPISVTCR